MPKLSIEECQFDHDRYHRIHKSGCRHLRDEEIMGDFTTVAELTEAWDNYSTEPQGDEEYVRAMLAPCAVKLLD